MQHNRPLASLPRQSYRGLLPHLDPVTLVFGDVLYETGSRIRDMYFPGKSVVSRLTVVDGHNALEVGGLVGRGGMVGLPLALGVETSPVRALVQGGGAAIQDDRWALSHGVRREPAIAASAATPTISWRRSRRPPHATASTGARIPLSYGVRRVGVTQAASALQRRGLIEYERGDIRIVNHAGLEAAACTCYRRAQER